MRINSNQQNFRGLKDIVIKNIGNAREGINIISGTINNKGKKDLLNYLNLKKEYYTVKDFFDFGKILKTKRLPDKDLKEKSFIIGYFYKKSPSGTSVTPLLDNEFFNALSFDYVKPVTGETKNSFFNRVVKGRNLRMSFISNFKNFSKDLLSRIKKTQTLTGTVPEKLKETMENDMSMIINDVKFFM